jgi:hypothetical protein
MISILKLGLKQKKTAHKNDAANNASSDDIVRAGGAVVLANDY